MTFGYNSLFVSPLPQFFYFLFLSTRHPPSMRQERKFSSLLKIYNPSIHKPHPPHTKMLSPKLVTSILSLIASTQASPIETTSTVNRTGLCGRQGDKMLGLNPELPGPACAFTATVSLR